MGSGARTAPRIGAGGFGGSRFAAPRAGVTRFAGPRSFGVASRPAFAARGGVTRFGGARTFGVGSRPAFSSRGVIGTRGFGSRGFVGARGFAPRFIGPRIVVSPFRFARPFYAFRPRFSLGFGLWVGFPIAYPSYYDYPYPYPYYGYSYPYATADPYAYPASTYGYPAPPASYPAGTYSTGSYPGGSYPAQTYPPSGSVGAQQGQDSGGVSFEITPNTARVYVDGTEVGSVAEFSPTAMPLTLTPGRHHIELRVAGYQTMAFDAEIVAGQVIPYRGEMQPQR
jgi:hypothetical protein